MSFDKILAIETATNTCSVCFQDNTGDIHEKKTERKGSHSELLFLFVKELKTEYSFDLGDLNAVLVSTGPGSYTGLRIATSAVKGMFFGLDAAIYAGNTLAGLAQTLEKGSVHAVINARRKHLYHQQFKNDGTLKAVSDSMILELNEIENKVTAGDQIIGTGIDRLSEGTLEKLKIADSSKISAKGLIGLFNSASRDEFFKKTTAEDLESNYLTSSQVNNTSI